MFFSRKQKPSGPIDFLVVGLGNPGKKYEGTRHNAGFMALEALAQKWGVKVSKVRFKSLCGEATVGEQRVLLMMPQTFMNKSGEAVREAMQFYKIAPPQVLVMFDDITAPVGNIRIRRNGSDGGQKGMRSIITLTGSDEYPRIKIGIGSKPHPEMDLAAWVLSHFSEKESPKLLGAINTAAQAAELLVNGQVDKAMNLYSR